MKKGEFLLKQLIQYKENDFPLYESVDDIHTLNELIIAVARYVNEIRYCSRPDCSCSPESNIKKYYEPLEEYLEKTRLALYTVPTDIIEEIIERARV